MNDDVKVPKHIGYIVDGNRRWAKKHGLPTYEGHLAGYNAIQEVARATFDAGVPFMSAYILHAYEKIYKKYLRDIDQLNASQLVEITYEDFTSEPLEELNKIYTQLNLGDIKFVNPAFVSEINSRSAYQTNSYQPLSKKDQAQIRTQWGFMFEAYGYST